MEEKHTLSLHSRQDAVSPTYSTTPDEPTEAPVLRLMMLSSHPGPAGGSVAMVTPSSISISTSIRGT
ncbi:hypothetical protein INR49_006698, partial [Caranx melampygus]